MTQDSIKKLEKELKDAHSENVFSAVGQVADQLSAIENFISRRFDEISMEINATSQQVDMAEEGITRKFAEILTVLQAISFKGDGSTPANAGVELDAVVEMTEKAANRILDAADRIAHRIHDNQDWGSDESKSKAIEDIDKDIEEILLACSFQDITGQRIRKTLESLKMIETRLGDALTKMGIEVEPPEEVSIKANSQDEIDKLFSGD